MSTSSIVIQSGEPLPLQLDWKDREGNAEAPVSVRYQVFDYNTNTQVSAQQTVASPQASMLMVIDGSLLPAGAERRRRLVVQIEAVFADGTPDIVLVNVFVDRGYTWS